MTIVKDEDKIGYQFWENLNKVPGISHYNQMVQDNQQFKEDLRSGKYGEKGEFQRQLMIGSEALVSPVSKPLEVLGTGINLTTGAISDATGVDQRSINAGLATLAAAKQLKFPKSGKFYQGVQSLKQKAGITPNVLKTNKSGLPSGPTINTKAWTEPSNFSKWWTKGKYKRIPNEDTASWGKLIKDDLSQIGKVKIGDNLTNIPNPLWSFTKV